MGTVRVCSFAVSLDGDDAGPDQDIDHPLGVGGTRLHEWVFETASRNRMQGNPGVGSGGVDDDFVARAEHGIGATVMGRNMFGPDRGAWGDERLFDRLDDATDGYEVTEFVASPNALHVVLRRVV
ncbi:MAG: hypothetical protein ACHQIG_07575 [Acidimicrobiia bacterium]